MSDIEASKKRYELGLKMDQLAEETTRDHPEIKVISIIEYGGILGINRHPKSEPADGFINLLEVALKTIQGDAV